MGGLFTPPAVPPCARPFNLRFQNLITALSPFWGQPLTTKGVGFYVQSWLYRLGGLLRAVACPEVLLLLETWRIWVKRGNLVASTLIRIFIYKSNWNELVITNSYRDKTLYFLLPSTYCHHLFLRLPNARSFIELWFYPVVFKVLCYKSEGRWFDPSSCHWNFSLT